MGNCLVEKEVNIYWVHDETHVSYQSVGHTHKNNQQPFSWTYWCIRESGAMMLTGIHPNLQTAYDECASVNAMPNVANTFSLLEKYGWVSRHLLLIFHLRHFHSDVLQMVFQNVKSKICKYFKGLCRIALENDIELSCKMECSVMTFSKSGDTIARRCASSELISSWLYIEAWSISP